MIHGHKIQEGRSILHAVISMGKIKFVIWGAGRRGEILLGFLGEDRVIGFIDKNHDSNTSYCGKPVFGVNEYLTKYSNYFVVVSPIQCNEIIETLQSNGIYQYFTLNDCPSEVKGFGVTDVIDRYLQKNGVESGAVLYGLTLFSVLFYEKAANQYNMLGIIPEKEAPRQTVECVERILGIPVLMLQDLSGQVHDSLAVYSVKDNMDKEIEEEAAGLPHEIYDIYDFSDVIDGYRNPRIERFKKIGHGRRCFIVATGPSLRISDLDTLKENKELCMGVNRIFKAFEHTRWRPDYYLMEDRDIYREEIENLLVMDAKYKLLSDSFVDLWEMGLDESYYKYHACQCDFLPNMPKFSADFAQKAYSAGTITYICLQLAVYMGFSQIYLLGVDFDYSYKDGNHFYKEDLSPDGKQPLICEKECFACYKKAKMYADEHGIKIYNATRGGKLEVFERVDFNALFK